MKTTQRKTNLHEIACPRYDDSARTTALINRTNRRSRNYSSLSPSKP